MSEYKENTVGWWLSQLKEPLRSRALTIVDTPRGMDKPMRGNGNNSDILSQAGAMMYVVKNDPEGYLHVLKDEIRRENSSHLRIYMEPSSHLINAIGVIFDLRNMDAFWTAVFDFFNSSPPSPTLNPKYHEGYNMAKECAPDNWLKPKDGGEDKAIVDSPKKTTELFFYGGKIISPFKEPLVISPRGEMLSVIVEDDKIKKLMDANPGIIFWPTNVGGVSPEPIEQIQLCDTVPVNGGFVLTNPRILVRGEHGYEEFPLSTEDFHYLTGRITYSDPIEAVSPEPEDSWQESQNMGMHSGLRNHPKLGEKQPEPAVVGYEIPKPIDTIEKKHELRIQNLEARVRQLEETVDMLTRLYIKE